MKKHTNRFVAAFAVAGSLGVASAVADVTVSSFDSYVSDALYASWGSATINSGATNYSVTATGYGSNYKYIGFPAIDGTGNTTVRLNVTLSGPPAAAGHLGPIVDLIDGDGTHYSYRWYGQQLGQHVLTRPVQSPDFINAAGTTPGLNLATLTHSHLQLDPGGFGASGAYTVAWNDLSLTGSTPPPPPTEVVITTFDNFTLDQRFGWSDATEVSGAESYSITDTGYGSGFESIFPTIDGTGMTNIELTVTLTGGVNQLGPIVRLVDDDGTEVDYAWYGTAAGSQVLSKSLSAGTTVAAGSAPGLNLSAIRFFHLQLDPSSFGGAYTAEFQHLRLTGPPSDASAIQITAQSYNPASSEFTLTWSSAPGKNYTIWHTSDLSTPMSILTTGTASQGNSTTATVVVPNTGAGFLRVQEE